MFFQCGYTREEVSDRSPDVHSFLQIGSPMKSCEQRVVDELRDQCKQWRLSLGRF